MMTLLSAVFTRFYSLYLLQITTGSELNALHVYHRNVTRALMSYDFSNATVRNDYNRLAILGNEEPVKKSNNTEFVSAVCCKKVRYIKAFSNSNNAFRIPT